VLIGATPEGRKELVGFTDGAPRERARLARSAARSETARARRAAPQFVIADGALGFLESRR